MDEKKQQLSEAEQVALGTYVKLSRAVEAVTGDTHRHLGQENLTTSQFGVLEALYHLGSMCQKEMAVKILKSSANITTVIDNLEKRGLVERVRSKDDRRFISLHLTGEGEELIRRVFPRHARAMAERFSVLSDTEQEELSRLCRKLGRMDEG